ncbi:MAG TPA: sensor histidine kinase [Desulfobulbaceae bacterium]|nr:sensor histidine kinase [Desulfobulbaceae bacterium]
MKNEVKNLYHEISVPLTVIDMLHSPLKHSRDFSRLLFLSLWFGVLMYIFSYALPLLVLHSSAISMATAVKLTCFTIPVVFLGGLFFSGIDTRQFIILTIIYTLLPLILLILYAGLIAGLAPFSLNNQQMHTVFFYFLLAITFVFFPLRKLIRNLVNHCMTSGHSDYRTLLCNFSGRISSSLHLPDLIEVLITDLPKQLGITSVGLMIMEEKRSRLYPETLRFGSYLWSASRLIVLLREGTHFFFCGPVADDPELSRELGEIRAAGFSLVYGLQGGSQFGGMLLLGPRKDGGGYSNRDVQVFSTLANQVTIAIENALNYETLSESNRQLQVLYNKLVQAEKMAALGEMTTILAHELRNPLGIIRSSAQFLVKGGRKPAMQQKLLGYIVDEVDNLNLVISNLLGLARHKPPHFRRVDLKVEIAESVAKWRQCPEHNKRTTINLTLPDHLPVLYADFKQLRQVLYNCFANSEEVMPNGGKITISVQELEKERLELRLTDTGPGVADDDLKLIFKKFFTTKKKGIGLGLPVCRQIVRAHNGSITFKNNPGGGASIILRLPLRPLITIGHGRQTDWAA